MVALTAKNLSLPHLSLSRTSSPSRSNSLNSTTTATSTTTPPSTAPTSPTVVNSGSTFSFSNPLALDRKKSKSTSPKHRPIDPPTPPTATHSPTELTPTSNLQLPFSDKEQVKDDKIRRSSFGASLSAFSIPSRSASPAVKSTSTPAGLSLTPASAQWSTHAEGPTTSGGGGGGLKPIQAAIAKSAGVVKDRGGALLMRSKSSDRAEGIAAAAALAQVEGNAFGAGGPPAAKKKGVMGAVRGLSLGQSVSQPAQSRATSTNGGGLAANGHPMPTRSASTHSPHLPPHSGTTTPTYPHADPLAGAGTRPVSQVHQLAESHVSQISLRLSETVNKVFMPSLHGAAGQQADKLEGTFFVPSSAVQEATGGKGRPCPRVVKSREFGEMLVSELHGAVHDSYLLKTILRSSVLKALSLFLSRLSALLLVPSSATDPSFNVPLSISISKDPKLQDSDSHFASNFPLALRYNLHIVRCATTVKSFLNKIAVAENGFPSFVEETLRPWRGKLTELIGRVMNPVVASYKTAIMEACTKSRIEGGITERGNRGRANSGDGELSSLGLNVAPLATVRGTSQVRSLSLGRSSTPTPLASAHHHSSVASSGPAWLQETSVIFEICSKLFARLDAKTDADRWAVGIAIAAVWKGMLGCSARIISEDGIVPSTPARVSAPAGVNVGVTVPVPVKNRLLGGVKKTPSPPPSPPLPALNLTSGSQPPSTCSPASIAFVRLIADLELFEHRLVTFLSATLSSPQVVFHPSAAPVDPCPGAPSCGLCKTGRTFDEESDSSDEDDNTKGGPAAGKESRLALSAMREARQALSSMIVCVRAMRDLKVLGEALKVDSSPSSSKQSTDPNAPLTPSDLFALGPAPSTLNQAPPPAVTVVSPSPAHPLCPTLRSAIIDLHPLLLLHLVLSRLPRSLPLRLPHEIWGLRGGWSEYESELRGFAAGEEWAAEIAWEVRGEIVKVRQDAKEDLTEVEQSALAVLEETVERVSRDAA